MPIGADKFAELPQTVNELIADRAIRHALYLERYKTHLVEEILKEFNGNMEPALLAKIEASLRRVTQTSEPLQSLFKANGELVKKEYVLMQAKLYDQLNDFADAESSWLIKTLQANTPIQWNFVAPSPAMLKSLVTNQPTEGALVKKWFSKLAADTTFAVNRQIQMGMVEGEGIEDIVRRIKGTRVWQPPKYVNGKRVPRPPKYVGGVLDGNRRHIQATVRTATSNVSHLTREEVYKANTDIIKGVQILATLDTRTCVECMNLDGKVYPVGEGRRPAFHWKCRCSDSPVLRSWERFGIKAKNIPASTRASMNGQVSDTLKYPQWLKKQSLAVQTEAFGGKKAGRERAELFRRGKVTIDKFVDPRNRPLTLKQLRKLEESVK